MRCQPLVDVDQARAGADRPPLPGGATRTGARRRRRRRSSSSSRRSYGRPSARRCECRTCGPADRLRDVRGGLAEDDRARPHAVEASADKKPRLWVGGAAGRDDGAVELPRELAQMSIGGGGREAPGPGWHRNEGAGGERQSSRALEELASVEAVHDSRLARGSSPQGLSPLSPAHRAAETARSRGGASRTRTGDLLGAIHEPMGTLGD